MMPWPVPQICLFGASLQRISVQNANREVPSNTSYAHAPETIINKYNSLPTASSAGHAPIPFIKEGAKPRQSKPPPPEGILASANDWEMQLDLSSRLYFPTDIIITDMRADNIIWSKLRKIVIISELIVPWEDNIDERMNIRGQNIRK